jgi:hypothetical protein
VVPGRVADRERARERRSDGDLADAVDYISAHKQIAEKSTAIASGWLKHSICSESISITSRSASSKLL